MKLKPLHDKVLVKRTDEEQTTPGELFYLAQQQKNLLKAKLLRSVLEKDRKMEMFLQWGSK